MRHVNPYRVAMFVAVAMLGALTLGGCASQQEAFNKAATPLAENMHDHYTDYVEDVADEQRQETLESLGTEFMNAVEVGLRRATADVWFRDTGFRDQYTQFLTEDESLNDVTEQIYMNNVETFDYIVSVGADGDEGGE